MHYVPASRTDGDGTAGIRPDWQQPQAGPTSRSSPAHLPSGSAGTCSPAGKPSRPDGQVGDHDPRRSTGTIRERCIPGALASESRSDYDLGLAGGRQAAAPGRDSVPVLRQPPEVSGFHHHLQREGRDRREGRGGDRAGQADASGAAHLRRRRRRRHRAVAPAPHAHRQFPTVPLLVVGKEISLEDVRLALEKMPDRFHEHPHTVVVMTNLNYADAPLLRAVQARRGGGSELARRAPQGSSAAEYDEQIEALDPILSQAGRRSRARRPATRCSCSPRCSCSTAPTTSSCSTR